MFSVLVKHNVNGWYDHNEHKYSWVVCACVAGIHLTELCGKEELFLYNLLKYIISYY